MEYKPSYYLIEGQTGGKYSARSVQAVLHQAVQKSGVDENTTVHTLRHLCHTFDIGWNGHPVSSGIIGAQLIKDD
jgi:site-specific recombinase XerD